MKDFDYNKWCEKTKKAKEGLNNLNITISNKRHELDKLEDKRTKQRIKIHDCERELTEALGERVRKPVEDLLPGFQYSCAVSIETASQIPYLIVEIGKDGHFKRIELFFEEDTLEHVMFGGKFELVHDNDSFYHINALGIGDALLKEI